jgi:uncharacterized protein (TIGR02597 family)
MISVNAPPLRIFAVLLLANAPAAFPTRAQSQVTTAPVGYMAPVSMNATGSSKSIPANTDVSISLPLVRERAFTGKVASQSGNSVTIDGAAFTSAQFLAEPHVIEIGSGNQEGVMGLLVSHNATACTASLQNGLSFNGIVAGDIVVIRKAWTLQSVFANATVSIGTMIFVWSGETPGVNLAPDLLYEFDGTDWLDLGNLEYANSTVLFPGERIGIRTPGSPLSNFTLVGEVPTTRFRAPLVNLNATLSQDIAVSYNSPLPELLANTNVGATASTGDLLLLIDNAAPGINKGASQLLEFDGSGWVDGIYTGDYVTDTFVLGAGMSLIYRRMPSATPTIWDQQPSYLPLE